MSGESTPKPKLFTVHDVVAQIQGQYLFDYAAFTGTLREYVVGALEAQVKAASNDLHLRAFALSVYREEYTAYEDLGAFVDAFLTHRHDPDVLPMERLLGYGPGEVKLASVIGSWDIETGQQLLSSLGLDTWIPSGWAEGFPDIDMQKVLLRACCYIVDDCVKSQKKEGISAFNKIKHAALVVPDGRRFFSLHPEGPAAIFLTRPHSSEPSETPVAALTITLTPDSIEERLRQVHFVQRTLRLLVLLFVLREHPEIVKSYGIDTPLDAFKYHRFTDLTKFARDLSVTEWQPKI